MVAVIWGEHDGVPASDRGLAYGDGVFETLRIQDNRPTLRARHTARLLQGAKRLGIALDQPILETTIDEAVQRYGTPDDWVLKLVLTRGSGGRGYAPPPVPRPRLIVSAHVMPVLPDPRGVVACFSSHHLVTNPALAGLKSLARLDQVMASQAIPPNCYEAIMTDRAGRLLEGTRTNLMLRFQDQWLTPPRDSVAVAGVMQARITALLQDQGERVLERPIAPAMLTASNCQGLLLMNSVIGAVPVRQIGCVRLPVAARLATIGSQSLFME